MNEQILHETDTDFEHYAVVERQYEGRPARVLFSGSRRAAQSGIGLDDNPDLLFDYNQRLLELANGIYPQKVLMIGGGAFTLPMALVAALPEVIVEVVELDPGLEAIARQYFGLRSNDRLKLRFGDGRAFIEQTAGQYDMIIIDVYSELSIPRQFLTLEFITELYNHLCDGGRVAVNIIASYQGRNTDLIKSQIAAYSSLFAAVDIFPAAHGLTSWLPQNLVLVAQKPPTQILKGFVRFAPFNLIDTAATDILHDAA